MKKKLSILMICFVLFLTSCARFEFNPDKANKVGNTTANGITEGYMAQQDNYVYYTYETAKGSVIHRRHMDGSGDKKIIDKRAGYINVVGENLYFAGKTEKGYYALYKSDIYGKEPVLLSDCGVKNVFATGDYVYFIKTVDKDGKAELSYLYRYDLNKDKEEVVLEFEISGFAIDNNKLYYVKLELDENDYFYRETYVSNLDGSDAKKILDYGTAYLFIDNENIYVLDLFKDTVWKDSINGGQKTALAKAQTTSNVSMTFDDKYIYLNDYDSIYKIDKISGEKTKVCEAEVKKPMQVINNELYFYGDSNGVSGLYKLVDGKPVKQF